MEKTSMQWRIPPGHRFVPTDAELISYYLYVKALGSDTLIDVIISTCNVYADAPWQLPEIEGMQQMNEGEEDDEQQWHYFFTETKMRSRNRVDRIAGDGFWKASTMKTKMYRHRTVIIGWRRQLTCFAFNDNDKRSSKNATKTKWIMHDLQLQNRTICKIHHRSSRKQEGNNSAASSTVIPLQQHYHHEEDFDWQLPKIEELVARP